MCESVIIAPPKLKLAIRLDPVERREPHPDGFAMVATLSIQQIERPCESPEVHRNE